MNPSVEEQVAALARLYRHLDGQRAELEEQQQQIRARVRDLLPVGSRVVVDDKPVAVTSNRRFDPALAAKQLPVQLLAACQVTKVDPATARKVLPPAVFESLMVEVGAPRVVLA